MNQDLQEPTGSIHDHTAGPTPPDDETMLHQQGQHQPRTVTAEFSKKKKTDRPKRTHSPDPSATYTSTATLQATTTFSTGNQISKLLQGRALSMFDVKAAVLRWGCVCGFVAQHEFAAVGILEYWSISAVDQCRIPDVLHLIICSILATYLNLQNGLAIQLDDADISVLSLCYVEMLRRMLAVISGSDAGLELSFVLMWARLAWLCCAVIGFDTQRWSLVFFHHVVPFFSLGADVLGSFSCFAGLPLCAAYGLNPSLKIAVPAAQISS
ncbi:hypothetical protein Nepgr_020351 [Nepenthes gracilis]|uniref:Uncharacterized protein n=1 Tax=Nepenthes gracilis TaxID=150966 RepID=A0AAD3XW71_NEPGR|nr:hypothetical protein Nepgr_020351 [Nepenthes gracilis]